MDLNHESFFGQKTEYVNEALQDQVCVIENVILKKNDVQIKNRFGENICKILFKIVEGQHKNKISFQELPTDIRVNDDGTIFKPVILRNLILNIGFYLEDEQGQKIIPDGFEDEIIGKKIKVSFKKNQNGFVKIASTKDIDL